MSVITQEFIEKIKSKLVEAKKESDSGMADYGHRTADDAICDLLKELGYTEIIQMYVAVDKWYS